MVRRWGRCCFALAEYRGEEHNSHVPEPQESEFRTRRSQGRKESTMKLKTNERTRSMIANQALINQGKPDSGQEPTNKQRRALIGGALVALVSSPAPGLAPEPA